MRIPSAFCWTRFGTEAGEEINTIIARKEYERCQNDGIFLWGVGNSVGPAIPDLLERERKPKVLFSPIKSAPRKCDVSPTQLALWTSAVGFDGKPYRLPKASIVTSRYSVRSRRHHFALVCRAPQLRVIENSQKQVRWACMRNLRSGRSLGPSQVTAIVSHAAQDTNNPGTGYPISMVAELAYPYFVRLSNPIEISNDFQIRDCNDLAQLTAFMKSHRASDRSKQSLQQPCLFDT